VLKSSVLKKTLESTILRDVSGACTSSVPSGHRKKRRLSPGGKPPNLIIPATVTIANLVAWLSLFVVVV